MDLDERGKKLVQNLGAAINRAVENAPEVAEAIDRLRSAGYQIELTLRLEVGLRAPDDKPAELPDAMPGWYPSTSREPRLDFTEEDIQTLRRMKIRLDD